MREQDNIEQYTIKGTYQAKPSPAEWLRSLSTYQKHLLAYAGVAVFTIGLITYQVNRFNAPPPSHPVEYAEERGPVKERIIAHATASGMFSADTLASEAFRRSVEEIAADCIYWEHGVGYLKPEMIHDCKIFLGMR